MFDIILVVKLRTSCCSFLKRLLKPEMYEEWIYYYGIEESDEVKLFEDIEEIFDI